MSTGMQMTDQVKGPDEHFLAGEDNRAIALKGTLHFFRKYTAKRLGAKQKATSSKMVLKKRHVDTRTERESNGKRNGVRCLQPVSRILVNGAGRLGVVLLLWFQIISRSTVKKTPNPEASV